MLLRLWSISCLFLSTTILFGQDQDYSDKHLEVALRTIGHQLLLENGDSTSRVLPIEFENGEYYISFESEFGFQPESLVDISNEVFMNYNLTSGYILQVIQCNSKEVVYSYEIIDPGSFEGVPCLGRELPRDCYQLVFELFGSSEETTLLTTVQEEQDSLNNIYKWIIGIMTVILLLILLLRKRNTSNSNVQNNIQLGSFIFDQSSGKLILNDQHVKLTGKENALLSLLYESANNTVKREEILQKVWGDEGDYVGRTLDVFVSKLRKKLELDQSVEISNIRGVGYKLVVNSI